MQKKVVILKQWFDPEPTSKGLAFAKKLADEGFDVEVVTGFPNYPGGKVYPGYRIKPIQKEVHDGVLVTRVALYPSHDRSAIKRVLNYSSFAASALFYCLFLCKKPNVIYAYHPPLTVGMVAAVIRMFRKVPVVYDIQDMWPDTLRATGMLRNERALGVISYICRWVYRRVDRIVVLSPGFKRLLVDRGVSEEKISVLYNWADESALSQGGNELASHFGKAGCFNIVFAGNMGRAQALNTILEAAIILKTQSPNVTFVFIGDGLEAATLKEKVVEKRLDNVIFIGRVSMSEVGAYLRAADALLVHLKKDPLFSVTIPSKTQAYLAIGKPILMGVDGDAADLVAEANAGVSFESENVLDLVEKISWLSSRSKDDLESMSSNARNFYNEKLSFQRGIKEFSHIFNEMIKK